MIALQLDAGSLGTLTGTLDLVTGIVRATERGGLAPITAARALRSAVLDGRIDLPVTAARTVAGIQLVAGL